MKADIIVTAAVAAVFAPGAANAGGEITPDMCQGYADAMKEAVTLAAEGAFEPKVTVVPDCDMGNFVVTVRAPAMQVHEVRTVNFDQVGAKCPPPKDREQNPAPETPAPPPSDAGRRGRSKR